jgi:hypothetical protein
MIVKCISIYPSEEQIQRLGPGFWRNREFGVVIGREYLVLGMTMKADAQSSGNGVWVEILMEPDIPTIVPVPICLFEIVDSRVSRHWEVRAQPDGSVALEPPAFFRSSFLPAIADRVTDAVEEFWKIQQLIEAESKLVYSSTSPK